MVKDLNYTILQLLVFEESFEDIVAESGLSVPIVKDVITDLIDKRKVKALVLNEQGTAYEASFHHDVDNMFAKHYKFIATKLGLESI